MIDNGFKRRDMEIIDTIFNIFWTLCGVIGFACIFCFVGFLIICIIEYRKDQEREKKLNEFWGFKND